METSSMVSIVFYLNIFNSLLSIRTPQARAEQDQNSNFTNGQTTETAPTASGLNTTGNFSINAMFNAHFGVRPPFMGSSWNIFGVPTYLNKDPKSDHYTYIRRTKKRHHPF